MGITLLHVIRWEDEAGRSVETATWVQGTAWNMSRSSALLQGKTFSRSRIPNFVPRDLSSQGGIQNDWRKGWKEQTTDIIDCRMKCITPLRYGKISCKPIVMRMLRPQGSNSRPWNASTTEMWCDTSSNFQDASEQTISSNRLHLYCAQ